MTDFLQRIIYAEHISPYIQVKTSAQFFFSSWVSQITLFGLTDLHYQINFILLFIIRRHSRWQLYPFVKNARDKAFLGSWCSSIKCYMSNVTSRNGLSLLVYLVYLLIDNEQFANLVLFLCLQHLCLGNHRYCWSHKLLFSSGLSTLLHTYILAKNTRSSDVLVFVVNSKLLKFETVNLIWRSCFDFILKSPLPYFLSFEIQWETALFPIRIKWCPCRCCVKRNMFLVHNHRCAPAKVFFFF